MFEWLEQEIAAIKTPRFHMVDGPADARLRKTLEDTWGVSLPEAYLAFVLKFGNTRLYRNLKNNGYPVGVFSTPLTSYLDDETPLNHLGFNDGTSVYTRPTCGSKNLIFQYKEEEEKRVADTFEQWLVESCDRARSKYSPEQWVGILAGPKPFTEQEREIIEARRMVRWKVLGIDSDGNFMIEVRNQWQGSLPVLTVGVRSKTRAWGGTKRLDIGDIGPGQMKVIHADMYKDLVPPDKVEVFPLPDPQPEDREYYWELAGLSRQ